jgi:hypothetical protein
MNAVKPYQESAKAAPEIKAADSKNDDLELFDPSQIFVSVHRCHFWDAKDNIRKGRIYLTNSELIFKCARMSFIRLRLNLRDITDVSKVKNYKQRYESVVLIETRGGKAHAFFKFKIPKNLVKNLILQLIEKHKRTMPLSSSDSGNGNGLASRKSESNTLLANEQSSRPEPVAASSSVSPSAERNAKVIFRKVSQPMKDKLGVIKPPRSSTVEIPKAADSPLINKRDSLEIRNEATKLNVNSPAESTTGSKKLTLSKIKKANSFDESTLTVTAAAADYKVNTNVEESIVKYVAKYAKNGKKMTPPPKRSEDELSEESETRTTTDARTENFNPMDKIGEEKAESCEVGSESVAVLASSNAAVQKALHESKTMLLSIEDFNKMEKNNRFILCLMFLSLASFTFITINNVMKVSQIELQILDLL